MLVGISLFSNRNTDAPLTGDQTNINMLATSSTVEIASREASYYGTSTRGWYAEPREEGNYPGVIVIHEWWGLNDQIKQTAEELAKNGYKVLAVDLYNGKIAATSSEAMAYSRGINQTDALNNMKAAAQYLQNQGITKIASLGWCFGGGQSLQLSLSDLKLDATALYYGQLVTEKDRLASVDAPVLGIFGDKDTSIPVARVQEFKQQLDELGITNEVYIYPGVGHAFANPSGMNYAPEETKDAWAKTLTFLNTHLK